LIGWIRIRNRKTNLDPDPGRAKMIHKNRKKTQKSEGISCFEVLDVLF
jgi:hypothetical protein